MGKIRIWDGKNSDPGWKKFGSGIKIPIRDKHPGSATYCAGKLRMNVLKGHGNEADFLGFLHKWVQHRYLTLHFEPFRF
jgi:hypothetical protein